MKKYAIVNLGSISTCPYADYYIKAFQKLKVSFDVIEWDRKGIAQQEQIEYANIIAYSAITNASDPRYTKVKKYFMFIQFLRKKIRENRYDKIIFLETVSAVICWDIIKKNYMGKYIVDIRDYSYEKYYLFRKIECMLIKNSFATVISSEGYKNFLPDYSYVLAHNYHEASIEKFIEVRNKNKTSKIRVTFIGHIRFLDINKRLIDLFSRDERFELGFYGAGAAVLQKFCSDNNYNNVKFHGQFQLEETVEFYGITDLINNLYGNHTPLLDYALSNKLYNSAEFGIPILVCEDTYMAEMVRMYNLGIVCNVNDENLPEYIYEKYINFNYKKMEEGRKVFLEKVKADNDNFYKRIENFIQL